MSSVPPADGLVGRESELALLTGRLRAVARGRGSAVLIEGEPGIGKSALVHAALAHARDADCEVFWGAGDELGQALPLVPFLEALRVREPSAHARRHTIVRLLRGEIATDRAADVPAALTEQLLALVTEQCAVRPTVVVIDDLQWTDAASVTLWGRLARLTGQMPLLLVGMMRLVPQRNDLLALRRIVNGDARLPLSGLTTDAVVDLVASLVGGKPDDSLLRLADGAAGNPLYVTELIAALARADSLTNTAAGAVRLASGSAPVSLSAAIADRLCFVNRPVRDVLRAAALLGVEFTVTDLATVLGRGAAELIPAVDEACTAGVLAESGNGLGFRHSLIRSALYDEMPTAVRAAWHRDAGRALAAADAPTDRVARQLLQAVAGSADTLGRIDTVLMDDWMLDWLTRTADHLVALAPAVAAELLARAITSSAVAPGHRDWLASRLADALYRIGDKRQAELVASRTLEQAAEPDLLVDLHYTLAQCSIRAGSAGEFLASLDRALATPGISARHRARLLVLAARTHCSLGEVGMADQFATRALAAASEAEDSWATGWALHVLTIVTAEQGQITDALPLFDRALAVTQADPAPTDLRLLLQINKAVALGSLDRYQEALAVADEARHLADQVGTAIRLAQAHGALGQLSFETGHWDNALTELEIVPEDLKEAAAVCTELGIAAVISLHRGDVDAARKHLEVAAPHAERIGHRLIPPFTLAQSLECEFAGAQHKALAVLKDGLNGSSEELEAEGLLPDGVRLAMQVRDLDTARSLKDRAASLAEGSDIPHRQANALYCSGMVDHNPHRLLAAAARYEDASRPLFQAKALEAAATAFLDADDRRQAREAFTRAVDVYTELGAAADIARLQAMFRAHGIRRGPHSKHRRASSGWDSLTPTETKIAGFVEEGLSNPEIAARLMLSRRTVATHVSHILKKLDVNSRTDIARESALRSIAAR